MTDSKPCIVEDEEAEEKALPINGGNADVRLAALDRGRRSSGAVSTAAADEVPQDFDQEAPLRSRRLPQPGSAKHADSAENSRADNRA